MFYFRFAKERVIEEFFRKNLSCVVLWFQYLKERMMIIQKAASPLCSEGIAMANTSEAQTQGGDTWRSNKCMTHGALRGHNKYKTQAIKGSHIWLCCQNRGINIVAQGLNFPAKTEILVDINDNEQLVRKPLSQKRVGFFDCVFLFDLWIIGYGINE